METVDRIGSPMKMRVAAVIVASLIGLRLLHLIGLRIPLPVLCRMLGLLEQLLLILVFDMLIWPN